MRVRGVFLFVAIISGCSQQPKYGLKGSSVSAKLPSYLSAIIRKYSLPFDEAIGSSSLIFYSSRHFDTSFLVHLRKDTSSAKGIVYYLVPSYHKDDVDYADSSNDLLFFEGYSFKIDSLKWATITDSARSILLDNKDSMLKDEACFDCPFYFITHVAHAVTSNGNNRLLFERYERFLKDSLLNGMVQKRKPKMHKVE